jgi:hypothetical protein
LDAPAQDRLENPTKKIALTEAAMPVLAEGGVIGDSAVEPEPTEPSIGQIEMNLLAQPPLRTYAEAVAYDEHSDHKLGVDRWPSDAAVKTSQLPFQLAEFDKPVYRPEQMVGRNVPFERKLIEQRSLFDLPMSHHDLQSCLPQGLNQ